MRVEDAIDFARAGEVSRYVVQTRVRVGLRAVRVIAEMERRLQHALAGEPLRGLRSLVPQDIGPYYAANVRSQKRHGIDTWLTALPSLCIDKDGALVMAWMWLAPRGSCRVEVIPVTPDKLLIEDVGMIAEAMRQVLARHVERSAATEERHARAGREVEELARALGLDL